jgi:hypothetical protein
MSSQEGIGRTYTCLCQRANGQAVCVDMKLFGTTEGLSQNSGFWVHISWAYDVMAQT